MSKCGYDVKLGLNITFVNANKINLESSSSISDNVTILAAGKGIFIGEKVWIDRGAIIKSGSDLDSLVSIDANSYIGMNTVVDGVGSVLIGKNVLIANSCSINSTQHKFDNLDLPIIKQPTQKTQIKIEDNVWIGARTVILPGVVIGEGSVVGAGSVVTKNVEPFSVVVGVPAKTLRSRLE